MLIAVTSRGKNRLSEMPKKFGKAENFVIFNTKTEEYTSFENRYYLSDHGSGVNNVKELLDRKIDVLIVKQIGEKSSEILKHSKIGVYRGKGRYIYEEVEDFLKGNLDRIKF
jgi:predicted Fe-Mo cluster-binding NifX family protein